MITQSQLAKELGVSQQAVSFALNETGTLSEATRKRILEGAERLGYRKNMASLMMQTGKTRSVGLLMRGHADSRMPQSLVRGLATWLDENNHTLSLVSVSEKQLSGEEEVPLVFREHRVDGCVVLVSGLKRGKLKPMLEASRMPYIWINERDPENAAYPDDFFLGQRGAEILMEHGCHRTAYSGDPGSGENKHYSVQARRDGYQKAMQAAGRPARMIDYSTPGTFEASVQNILQADDRPDGVLCYGLREAQCFYLAARSLQLRIPDDLKILMIGEPGNNSIGTVEFALLRIPMFQTGIKAMELLETRMDGSSIDVPSVAVQHEQLDEGSTL